MDELFSIIEYKYNEYNDKISLMKYDTERTKTYEESYEYVYDNQGNWTKKINFENGKKVSEEFREISYF